MPCAWERATHEDGRTYYINSETDATSWSLPDGFTEDQIEDYVSESGSTESSSDDEDAASAAATPPPAPVAAAGKCPWARCTHDDGRTYYMNEDTDKTSWTLPEGLTEEQIKDFVSEESGDSESESESEGPSPCPWSRCTHDDGRTYYMNEATETTSWTLPEGFSEEQIEDFVSDDSESGSESESESEEGEGDAAAAASSGPCPWQRTTHDDGRVYFMNFETEDTSWVLPEGWTDEQIADYDSDEEESESEDEEDEEGGGAIAIVTVGVSAVAVTTEAGGDSSTAVKKKKKKKKKQKIPPKTAWALTETQLLEEKAKGAKKKRAKRKARLAPPTSSGTKETRKNTVTSVSVGSKPKKAFSAMKKKRKYDHIILRIDVATSTLEIEKKGTGGYSKLKDKKKGKKVLPADGCRYVLLDTGRKLFVVVWIPRSAPSDAVAMYNLLSRHVATPFIGATKISAQSLPELLKCVGGPAKMSDGGDEEEEEEEEWDPDA